MQILIYFQTVFLVLDGERERPEMIPEPLAAIASAAMIFTALMNQVTPSKLTSHEYR